MREKRDGTCFPERLQYLREKRKMSRLVLGQLCGLSKNQIGRYERGEREPTGEVLCALAEYFGCSVDYLLCRDEDDYL